MLGIKQTLTVQLLVNTEAYSVTTKILIYETVLVRNETKSTSQQQSNYNQFIKHYILINSANV